MMVMGEAGKAGVLVVLMFMGNCHELQSLGRGFKALLVVEVL